MFSKLQPAENSTANALFTIWYQISSLNHELWWLHVHELFINLQNQFEECLWWRVKCGTLQELNFISTWVDLRSEIFQKFSGFWSFFVIFKVLFYPISSHVIQCTPFLSQYWLFPKSESIPLLSNFILDIMPFYQVQPILLR